MMTSISEPVSGNSTSQKIENPAPTERVRNLSFYKQALTPHLDPAIFKPNPNRVFWYSACVLGSLAGFLAIAVADVNLPLKLLFAVLIGLCNGTLGFLIHEIAHGSVVKNQTLQNILFFIGGFPFLLSPTYWKFSHNRLHHGKAQKLIEDPDAFPTIRIFRNSKFMQFMFPFTPGSGHKRSVLYFFFWFTFHNFVSQIYLRFRNKTFDAMNHRRVTIEFAATILVVLAVMAIAGPANWLFVILIPFAIQNYILMSYISTNHNLSPLTTDNDPLANTLSVTNHPVLEYLNMNFGYHVEHHLFPTVNGKHAKAIHRELVRQFPDTYKIMPKLEAMKALYRTPRIYKNAHQLVHPETGDLFDTI